MSYLYVVFVLALSLMDSSRLINAIDCSHNPCLNGGLYVCDVNNGTQKCLCLPDYGGLICQSYFKCETNPCMNGATCFLNELHQTSCICPHGLTGNYCQTVLDCNCHPCLNGGSCIMTNGTAKCLCTSDYDGILCQTGKTASCATITCLNGGSCVICPVTGVASCVCPPGVSGLNCEQTQIHHCTPNNCLNGGTCAILSGKNVCWCLSNYTGSNCETPVITKTCNETPCANGGTCQKGENVKIPYCKCAANYYGEFCEVHVTLDLCNATDTNADLCSSWNKLGLCKLSNTYKSIPIPVYCPYSCGACKRVSLCSDSQDSCSAWADARLCERVRELDPNLCKRSCGLCGNLV